VIRSLRNMFRCLGSAIGTESRPDDEQPGSYRFIRRIGTEKLVCVNLTAVAPLHASEGWRRLECWRVIPILDEGSGAKPSCSIAFADAQANIGSGDRMVTIIRTSLMSYATTLWLLLTVSTTVARSFLVRPSRHGTSAAPATTRRQISSGADLYNLTPR